jgi:hypothetical protein
VALLSTLLLNAFAWLLIPVSWLVVYCTGDCPASAGVLFNTANWLNLISGFLTMVAIGMHLRRDKRLLLPHRRAELV